MHHWQYSDIITVARAKKLCSSATHYTIVFIIDFEEKSTYADLREVGGSKVEGGVEGVVYQNNSSMNSSIQTPFCRGHIALSMVHSFLIFGFASSHIPSLEMPE
jgi:hypothetical protein